MRLRARYNVAQSIILCCFSAGLKSHSGAHTGLLPEPQPTKSSIHVRISVASNLIKFELSDYFLPCAIFEFGVQSAGGHIRLKSIRKYPRLDADLWPVYGS